ncbi:MAG: carboxymuconolactone decarboxylase family protein [Desulfitobacterium hafniense]|nr:carboxymuconolactone decarboxylase family protein [Desulfitobacterium hafniense]
MTDRALSCWIFMLGQRRIRLDCLNVMNTTPIKKLQSASKLDAKTFQLIYIALQAQNGGAGSVAGHTALAKKAGATREEVMGAVLTTLMLGVNGVADCLAVALESYDNAPA